MYQQMNAVCDDSRYAASLQNGESDLHWGFDAQLEISSEIRSRWAICAERQASVAIRWIP
jgi:hypothetical protein